MLDHLGINVSDYDRSREFYAKALEPLGYGAFALDLDANNVEAVCHKPG